ncbi:transposase [Micromonospora sp. CB01531]|uniref:transposase n=1 Tax=Micromonospora sp. CB01531 TaxID=1718947 RepID=UPI0018E9FB46|nr:transposase [Micromonospora sp. CB01531]
MREVVNRLIAAGHWRPGDPPILIVTDTGYDITRLAFVLADLPVQLLGRLRADRVLRLPKPPRHPGATGRPRGRRAGSGRIQRPAGQKRRSGG